MCRWSSRMNYRVSPTMGSHFAQSVHGIMYEPIFEVVKVDCLCVMQICPDKIPW